MRQNLNLSVANLELPRHHRCVDAIDIGSKNSRITLAETLFANSTGFLNQKRIHIFGFVLCLLLIGAVSAHDTQLAVENIEIAKVEKNPICLSLINLDPNGFTYFVLGKSIGTFMVISMLCLLAKFQYRHVKLVTLSIVAFQMGLLIYLHLSDPRIGGLPNFALLFGDSL